MYKKLAVLVASRRKRNRGRRETSHSEVESLSSHRYLLILYDMHVLLTIKIRVKIAMTYLYRLYIPECSQVMLPQMHHGSQGGDHPTNAERPTHVPSASLTLYHLI